MPPAGPKGEGNLIFTVAYVISKNCKNPEAAWEVINYLTGIENQTTALRTGFALPSRKALLDDPYFEEHPVSATIFRAAEIGTPFMWGLHGSDINEQMAKALERIYLEGVSCEADPFIRLISVARPSPALFQRRAVLRCAFGRFLVYCNAEHARSKKKALVEEILV